MSDRTYYMELFLGEYEVVEHKEQLGTFAIHLGSNVYVNIHILGLPNVLKPGDKLPLFTKVPYNPRPIEDAIAGKEPKQ